MAFRVSIKKQDQKVGELLLPPPLENMIKPSQDGFLIIN
jgi:hypothetical protein